MTHRAETIIDAVVTAVTNLTTTGANVKRGRVNAWPDSKLPALSVYMGPDNEEGIDSSRSRWALSLYIESHVKTSTEQVDTVLNKIREEVTVAMLATEHLGLGFVFDVAEGDADEPELYGESDKPVASQRLNWLVRYTRNTNNPGA